MASEITDPSTGEKVLQVEIKGHALLRHPHLNKGTAFTVEERDNLGLRGLLPSRVTVIDEQLPRCYEAYKSFTDDLQKHIYLASLHDRNETLFYRLVSDHLKEMAPKIYTPVVADACRYWSRIFRRARGLYISLKDAGKIKEVLGNYNTGFDPQVIVVTDNERILGIGDQGTGGMGIPIGKLALYTLGGGIHPAKTLPISLDVGTDNQELLNDPMYLGLRQKRLRGDEYWAFVDEFVAAVKSLWPSVLLQWEDFGKSTSFRHLDKHVDNICSFNDDIQGTASVSVAGLFGAVRITKDRLSDQVVVLVGAGSAGVGIARLIVDAMVAEGTPRDVASSKIFTLDSQGLVVAGREGIERDPFKVEFAVDPSRIASWGQPSGKYFNLLEVVQKAKPTVLFGVSGQHGIFTEEIIKAVHQNTPRPIVLPLSNPTSCCEAVPQDIIRWTNGDAIVATGSPFEDFEYNGKKFVVGQGNNVFIFPGVGLGVIVSKAKKVTNGMFLAAAQALAHCVPDDLLAVHSVYPSIDQVRVASLAVAVAVVQQAIKEGVAEPMENIEAVIKEAMWEPTYRKYQFKDTNAPRL